jgi:hypothetical protein
VARELSIFVDESGDFGRVEAHSPFYVLSIVLHDQSEDISGHLARIHDSLRDRGLAADHAIHTGPLVRREHDYRWLDLPNRRSLFRVLVDFARVCRVAHHSWVFDKRGLDGSDALVGTMSRELGAFIRGNYEFFVSWDRIVIYYDNGQKEITTAAHCPCSAGRSNLSVCRSQRMISSAQQATVQSGR